jgi:hypothetical protein
MEVLFQTESGNILNLTQSGPVLLLDNGFGGKFHTESRNILNLTQSDPVLLLDNGFGGKF